MTVFFALARCMRMRMFLPAFTEGNDMDVAVPHTA